MSIGIAVTTTASRKNYLQLFSQQIAKHTPEDIPVIVINDVKGIAKAKNECLRELMAAGCEHLFLFDDDCFPVKDGWCKIFVEASKAQSHYMYLRETPSLKRTGCIPFDIPHADQLVDMRGGGDNFYVNTYNNCAGCMMYLTSDVVERVGAFDESFGMYGFEHADYSIRAHRAGFTPYGTFSCPANASQYIHSLDLDGVPDFAAAVIGNHRGSLDINEQIMSIEKSRQHFDKVAGDNDRIFIKL